MRVTVVWLKVLVIIAAVVGLSLAGGTTALATSDRGTQNADLTVFASLLSDGPDPDRATAGDTVTETVSVTNNTPRRQAVRIAVTIEFPGDEYYTASRTVFLKPGQTLTETRSYIVRPFFPNGLYQLTASATNGNGTSSATASITVY